MNKQVDNISRNGIRSIFQNSAFLMGGRWINMLVRMFYIVILARLLGAELYGIYNYGISIYMPFFVLTSIGIGQLLSNLVASDKTSGHDIVSQTFTLRLIAGILSAISMTTIGWLTEEIFQTKVLFLFFSIALIGRTLAIWVQEVFTAYEINQHSFHLQLIFRPIECLLALIVLVKGGSILALALVHAISWWLQALSGLKLVRKNIPKFYFSHKLKHISYLLPKCLIIGLTGMLINWMNQGAITFTRYMEGMGNSLGQFALAMQGVLLLSSIIISFNDAALPVLTQSVHRQDGKDIIYVETQMRLAIFLGAISGLTGMFFGTWLVNLLFGPKYLEAGQLLGFTMWLLIPFLWGNALNALYLARSHYQEALLCAFLGILSFLTSLLCFAAHLGNMGVILSSAAGMIVWSVSLIIMMTHPKNIDLKFAVLQPSIIVIISLSVYFIFYNYLAFLLSMIVIISGVYLFGLSTSEKDTIKMLYSFYYSKKEKR